MRWLTLCLLAGALTSAHAETVPFETVFAGSVPTSTVEGFRHCASLAEVPMALRGAAAGVDFATHTVLVAGDHDSRDLQIREVDADANALHVAFELDGDLEAVGARVHMVAVPRTGITRVSWRARVTTEVVDIHHTSVSGTWHVTALQHRYSTPAAVAFDLRPLLGRRVTIEGQLRGGQTVIERVLSPTALEVAIQVEGTAAAPTAEVAGRRVRVVGALAGLVGEQLGRSLRLSAFLDGDELVVARIAGRVGGEAVDVVGVSADGWLTRAPTERGYEQGGDPASSPFFRLVAPALRAPHEVEVSAAPAAVSGAATVLGGN